MTLQEINEAMVKWADAYNGSSDPEERKDAKFMLEGLAREKDEIIARNMAQSPANQMYHIGE